MKIDFRQGVVSHQETGFLEPNGSGGVRIAASTRSTTITLAHRDTNYTHSEDNNVENAWPGPFPAGDNYYLYWEFNQLTFLRSFGYTTLEPVSQSVPPGSGNSPIIAAVPGVASPVSFGSFEVQGHFDLPVDKVFAVVGSTGSPNNDGMYTVKTAVYNLVTGNTTITVNEAVATATASGELTLDIDSTGLPLFVTGRNWYDTANHINYVLDISNQWVEVLRVYAANLFGGTTFLSMSQTGNFTGTQIGDNSPVASGRVLFGDAGNPIRRDDNTFFTTEDQFFTNQSRVDAIRLESNVSRAQAFSSSLAQFGIVAWRDDGQIASATYDDTGNTVVGVLTESILVGQVGAVITQGTVTNSAWNWTATLSVGAKLWILDGGLVGIDPNVSDPNTYSTKQVAVARVLGIDTIIFEQGLGGVGPQGATGSISDLPVATTSELGVVFLSHAATNPLIPIAVGENHPVITGGPYSPISHSHTALQTSFTPGNNIAASDVQNAIAELAIEKLNLSGGTMTGPGFLTLANTPTDDFHAATKQYVDGLFLGIDAKEACLVGTTEALGDIGGLYSSIGGTGGTGSIAGALVSQLDGDNGVDFVLGVDARVLVKDQDDALENGIYSVTALGAGSPITTIDIERASDFDHNDDIRAGNYTVLRSGLEQAGQGWVLTDIHPIDDIELNVHPITWTLVSAPANYIGDPNTISIDLANTISVIPASGSPSGQVDAKFWLGNEILVGSPTNGDSLIYNDSSLKWENGAVVNPLCDLVVTCLPGSDTITSTKDLFALNINSNTGVSVNSTTPTEDSGYDLAGLTVETTLFHEKTPDDVSITDGIVLADNGTKAWWMINASGTPRTIHERTLATPFDISTAGSAVDKSLATNTVQSGAITRFNNDGTKLFCDFSSGAIGNIIEEYAVSSAWDIDTAVYTASSPALIQVGDTTGYSPYFSNDGLHVYVGTRAPAGRIIHEYVLGTAWDITSLSYVDSLNVSANVTGTRPIMTSVSKDGLKVFVAQVDGAGDFNHFNTYTLGVAYDISSASWSSLKDLPHAPFVSQIRSYNWDNTGTRLYTFDDDRIWQWDTSAGDGGTGSTFTTLYYGGSTSLTTTASGVEVTGILSFAAEGSPSSSPQIVLPNYVGSPAAFPATTLEGGMVWDSTTKAVTVYDGTAWTAVGGGADQTPWLSDIDANGFSLVTANAATVNDINITVGASTAYFGQGNLNLTGGLTDYGTGGYVTIRGGDQTTSGSEYTAGTVQLYGGTDIEADYHGGYVLCYGGYKNRGGGVKIGTAYSHTGRSGNILIRTEAVSYQGINSSSGDVNIETRNGYGSVGTAYAGDISIRSGNSQNAPASNVSITAGRTTSITADGGNITLTAGKSGAAGGSINLTPGDGASNGTVNLHNASASVGQATMRLWNDTNTSHTTGFAVTLKPPALTVNTTFELPPTDGTSGQVLTAQGSGVTEWVDVAVVSTKPLYEKIVIGGSPVSQVLATTVSTTATAGSPVGGSTSLQVFRNGILQNEDVSAAGSPLEGDFQVTGANELTFAPDSLQPGGVIIIYVFN